MFSSSIFPGSLLPESTVRHFERELLSCAEFVVPDVVHELLDNVKNTKNKDDVAYKKKRKICYQGYMVILATKGQKENSYNNLSIGIKY